MTHVNKKIKAAVMQIKKHSTMINSSCYVKYYDCVTTPILIHCAVQCSKATTVRNLYYIQLSSIVMLRIYH